MTVLLVGADRLGNMPKELEDHGASEIIHWSGRKERNREIPRHVDMVLVVHDYVNQVHFTQKHLDQGQFDKFMDLVVKQTKAGIEQESSSAALLMSRMVNGLD